MIKSSAPVRKECVMLNICRAPLPKLPFLYVNPDLKYTPYICKVRFLTNPTDAHFVLK